MILFAFNLYKQINLFAQHFLQINILIHLIIYIRWSALGAWCPPWWLVVLPGILARIFTAGHPDGHATRLLSAAGSLASESKLQGEIDRCDYSYYQLFRCSFRVCFYIAMYRLKH